MTHPEHSDQGSEREPAFQQNLGITSSVLKFATGVGYRRMRADIALRDLAERTGIAEERLAAIEKGSDITLSEALRIAHALDMTVGIEPMYHPSPPQRSPLKLRAELLLFAPMAKLGDPMISVDYMAQLPIDEEERFLMDYDTWDWETFLEVHPDADPVSGFVVRFTAEELEQVKRAAQADGMTVNELLKHLALRRALHENST